MKKSLAAAMCAKLLPPLLSWWTVHFAAMGTAQSVPSSLGASKAIAEMALCQRPTVL
jgi:hypothetical protein